MKINIGTTKGNITNYEIDKDKFEDINTSDIISVVNHLRPGARIIGWSPHESSPEFEPNNPFDKKFAEGGDDFNPEDDDKKEDDNEREDYYDYTHVMM